MIRLKVAALGMALATLPGLATQPALAEDKRLVERLYDPAQVVRIEGRVNVQAAIRFGEDEAIQNIGIGNSQEWQVSPTKGRNIVFIKPLSPRAATNMTVVTDKHTYLFDLVASPNSRAPLYMLTFTYPEPPAPTEEELQLANKAPAAQPNALEMAAANDSLAVLDPAQLNFDWRADGDSALVPERIYDNGEHTFLEWGPDAPIPAIFVKDHEGTLGAVNWASRGNTLVIDFVPAEIYLRSGDDAATLVNEKPPAQAARSAATRRGA